MRRTKLLLFGVLTALLLTLAVSQALAGPVVIGQWDGSGRSWNNVDFSVVNALMVAQGYTVTADQAMSAANLAGDTMFVVGEASAIPGASELSALASWVSAGGVLLVFGDSGGNGATGNNAIYAAIGSSISQASDSGAVAAALAGGVFATTGPPYDIVGQTLSTTPGATMSGGTELAGSYIRYQQVGLGWVFGFGDRSDHDFFGPSTGNVNGQLFLNLAAHAPEGGAEIPEPFSAVLLGSGLLVVVLLRRRQRCSSAQQYN